MAAIIRPYQPADRAAVHQIAADSAFFGRPVEAFLPDRRPFLDVFVSYYTDLEPEHTWVVVCDDVVAGYLSSSLGGSRLALGELRLGARALFRMIGGGYRLGRRGWAYIGRSLLAALRGDYPHADRRYYPAHLHINVAEQHRSLGLGRRLLETCFAQMAQIGVPGISLNTTSANEAAVALYESTGFRLLGRRRTHLWETLLPGLEVYNLCYGREVTAADRARFTVEAEPAP